MLRHVPTGISVRCDDERDQYRNRIRAYRLLLEKLQTLVDVRRAMAEREMYRERKRRARRPRGVQERVLREKKQRGEIKKERGSPLSHRGEG